MFTRIEEWWFTRIASLIGLWAFFALSADLSFILQPMDADNAWTQLAFILSWSVFAASLGYWVNDVFDRKKDALGGKTNTTAGKSLGLTITTTLVLIVLTTSCVWVLPLHNTLVVIGLVGLQIALFFLYAMPYLRFKERPLGGIVVDSVYAYVLPNCIVFLVVYDLDSFDRWPQYLVLIGSWSFIAGCRSIINHHWEDRSSDTLSNTRTAATVWSKAKVLRWLKIYLPTLEIIFFSLFLWFGIGWIGLALYLGYLLWLVWRSVDTSKLDGVRLLAEPSELSFQCTLKVYALLLPFLSIVMLAMTQPIEGIVIGLIWCGAFYKSLRWAGPDLKFVRTLMVRTYFFVLPIYHASYWFVFKILSRVVNYSIYYVALLFGRNLKKEKALITDSSSPSHKDTDTAASSSPPQKSAQNLLQTPVEKCVHMLWIGPQTGLMEQLTLASFVHFGYDVHLWLYSETSRENVPDKVKVMDANAVISSEEVFHYKKGSQFGTGKGSVAGFSDIFRYKLLHDYGGWWVDMDVTCLKAFDVETPYFFRGHHNLPLVGNIMKAPKGSPLMWSCYTKAKEQVTADNRDWHLPIQILVDEVLAQGLEHCIYHGMSNTDEFDTIAKYFVRPAEFPVEWCAIHWCNEVLRSRKIDVRWMPKEGRFMKELNQYKISAFYDKRQEVDLAPWEVKMIQIM